MVSGVLKSWSFQTSSIKHLFSDSLKKDTFKITLSGDSLLASQVTFEIIDSKGIDIYIDTFPAIYLLGFASDVSDTRLKKEIYITNRIKEFFSPDNFLLPAIKKEGEMDPEYSQIEKAIWNEIKSDPNKVGFYYLQGEEDGRRIAYSKKLQKVVIYFACC